MKIKGTPQLRHWLVCAIGRREKTEIRFRRTPRSLLSSPSGEKADRSKEREREREILEVSCPLGLL